MAKRKSPVQKERERRGWSQGDLARRVGVSGAQISRIETQGVKGMDTPIEIVKALDYQVTLDQVCHPERYTREED